MFNMLEEKTQLTDKILIFELKDGFFVVVKRMMLRIFVIKDSTRASLVAVVSVTLLMYPYVHVYA